MKSRNIIKDESGNYNLVMFGSYGLNPDGTAKRADNYVEDAEAIRVSLIEKLSIIKGELWYNINFGQPLFDKNKSKLPFDSFVLQQVNSTPGVIAILSFDSKLENNVYFCKIKIQSEYGNIDLTL